jgi:hypothetical protein
VQLEFKYLAHLTDSDELHEKADRSMAAVADARDHSMRRGRGGGGHSGNKRRGGGGDVSTEYLASEYGLLPMFLDPQTGRFVHGGDSTGE